MQNGTLIKTLFLRASPEKVWAYLTESDKLSEWFHPSTDNLKKADDYTLLNDEGGKQCWGTVTESKPYSFLEYTFHHNHVGGHTTRVRWELEALHGGTQLVLTHMDLDQCAAAADALEAHDKGWDEGFARLRDRIAA